MPLSFRAPVSLAVRPQLTRLGRQLLSGKDRGIPVHAATFIRRRRMVLERELYDTPAQFRFVLIHELFHFVWAKLGNVRRREFEQLLREQDAQSEVGESSSVALEEWVADRPSVSAWKNYVCECFCDSAAAVYYGGGPLLEYALTGLQWMGRQEWFRDRQRNGWIV